MRQNKPWPCAQWSFQHQRLGWNCSSACKSPKICSVSYIHFSPHKDITSFNKSDLLSLRSLVVDPPPLLHGQVAPYLPRYSPCSATHPALSSCFSVPLDRFFTVVKWMLPIYGSLHFVPAVLFKWKVFMQDPGKVLLKAGLGSLRSSAFLGVFVVIDQSKLIPLRWVFTWWMRKPN